MRLIRSGGLQASAGWCGVVTGTRSFRWRFVVVRALGVNATSHCGGLETSAPGELISILDSSVFHYSLIITIRRGEVILDISDDLFHRCRSSDGYEGDFDVSGSG